MIQGKVSCNLFYGPSSKEGQIQSYLSLRHCKAKIWVPGPSEFPWLVWHGNIVMIPLYLSKVVNRLWTLYKWSVSQWSIIGKLGGIANRDTYRSQWERLKDKVWSNDAKNRIHFLTYIRFSKFRYSLMEIQETKVSNSICIYIHSWNYISLIKKDFM